MTKDYMADNHIFADAFNYFIYDGKQVIKPEKIHSLDTTMISVPYGADGVGVPAQKYRDMLKGLNVKQDDSAVYLLLGIENQSDIHYAMPVKNMVYDALQYAAQVEKAAKAHREILKVKDKDKQDKQPTSGEYLTGFYKEDRLLPVITLVVYFGPEIWDGPTSLHEMFSVDEAEILSLVPDYKLNLIAPANMTKDEMDRLTTDLREVLLFIKYSKDKTRLAELMKADERFKSLDHKAVRVINAVTNLNVKVKESESEVNMCIAIDEMCEDARTEEKMEIALRMLKKGDFSYEQISEITLLPIEKLKVLKEREVYSI